MVMTEDSAKVESGTLHCRDDGCDWSYDYINPLDGHAAMQERELHEEVKHGI